jgi:hypothetical protein
VEGVLGSVGLNDGFESDVDTVESSRGVFNGVEESEEGVDDTIKEEPGVLDRVSEGVQEDFNSTEGVNEGVQGV